MYKFHLIKKMATTQNTPASSPIVHKRKTPDIQKPTDLEIQDKHQDKKAKDNGHERKINVEAKVNKKLTVGEGLKEQIKALCDFFEKVLPKDLQVAQEWITKIRETKEDEWLFYMNKLIYPLFSVGKLDTALEGMMQEAKVEKKHIGANEEEIKTNWTIFQLMMTEAIELCHNIQETIKKTELDQIKKKE